MNIGQRINARKIVFSYFYQKCFFDTLAKQEGAITDALFIDNIFKTQEESFKREKEELINAFHEYNSHDFLEDITYYVEVFFDKWPLEEIDMDYVMKVGNSFDTYHEETIKAVNERTQSFTYDQMDTIDQALFHLGYIENKVLWTPKEVIINELIEISKRYADEGSSKLINGIMHHILTEGKQKKSV